MIRLGAWRGAVERAITHARTLVTVARRTDLCDLPDAALAERLTRSVLGFVATLQVGSDGIRYRYARECILPTLYSSAYACMIHAMLGALPEAGSSRRIQWVRFFDSCQRDDGLFHDPAVDGPQFGKADWWGARHLAVHLIQAYASLGARPPRPFAFLAAYQPDTAALSELWGWLDDGAGAGDGDNRIMNVGCLLQYQRDVWGDEGAGHALARLKDELRRRIDPVTGLWGRFHLGDRAQLSRAVQVAYHLLPIFLYDGETVLPTERVVAAVQRLQNRLGGFSPRLNASACEDIDAIDVLLALVPRSEARGAAAPHVRATARRALRWVLANQMPDGGFVFRLHEPLAYGSREMSSRANQGAMFPTWFRLMSIGSLTRYLGHGCGLPLARCPGYGAYPAWRVAP